ncbi:MAG TPA: acyl-CoA thioester hydrolase [Dysgonomonas sp.]|nr:acyl-CoA thioester hydrolase [Dysgonomonas sp.]
MEKEIVVEEFKASVPIQIRFNDIDALGHINNNVYFSFFDLGKTTYFEDLKASYVSWTDGIVVIARIEVDFIAPVFYKEQIVVDSKITKIGNKSAVFMQQIRNSITNEIKCRAMSVVVTYNPKTMTAMPIPAIWRNAISEFEGIEF